MDSFDEEFDVIVERGINLHLNHPIESMKELLEEHYDAIFVGTGAPHGRELDLPGRHDSDQIHIGIAWLESVAFEHIDSVGERVIIVGGGNTAMDCCRTSLRLGGKDVKVIYRGSRDRMKSSDWEWEPALEALRRFGYSFDARVGAEWPGGGVERWKPIAAEHKHRESGLAASAVQPEDWGR